MPDIIPPPQASTASHIPLLPQVDRATSKEILSTLNLKASSAQQASTRLQQTLADVQRLIGPGDLPTLYVYMYMLTLELMTDLFQQIQTAAKTVR